jgi:hypothetical protein
MPLKKKTQVNKYPEGDTRNGLCKEHINVALFWLRMGLTSNEGLPLRMNQECFPLIKKAIKDIEKHFKPKPPRTYSRVTPH